MYYQKNRLVKWSLFLKGEVKRLRTVYKTQSLLLSTAHFVGCIFDAAAPQSSLETQRVGWGRDLRAQFFRAAVAQNYWVPPFREVWEATLSLMQFKPLHRSCWTSSNMHHYSLAEPDRCSPGSRTRCTPLRTLQPCPLPLCHVLSWLKSA